MKKFAPGIDRHSGAILEVLEKVLPVQGTVLEVGAGTGQHAATFAAKLSWVTWIATDVDEAKLDSIAAWRREAGLPNLRAPLRLDVTEASWDLPPEIVPLGAIVAIDLLAAAPRSLCVGLLNGAGRYLQAGGVLVIHGALPEEATKVAASRGLELAPSQGAIAVFRRRSE